MKGYCMNGRSLKKKVVLPMIALMVALTGCGQSQTPASGSSTEGSAAPTASAAATPEATELKFPERAVTLIVPATAGGASDLLSRAIEKVWTKYVDEPVLVVNKSSAGGVDAANFVAKAKPDGYTLLVAYGAGQDIIAPHMQKLPYDSIKDFAPISLLSITSAMIAAPANSQFNSLKDVVEYGKKETTPITAAVSSTGSTGDLAIRGFGKTAGINITPVPHQGGSQMIISLVGAQTMIGAGAPAEIMPQVKAGKLKALGVSFPERDPIAPDVPTFKEQGVDFSTWGALRAVAAPAGTPKEIISYLDGVFKQISQDADFKKLMDEISLPVIYKSTDEVTALYKETYDSYGKMVDEFDIKP